MDIIVAECSDFFWGGRGGGGGGGELFHNIALITCKGVCLFNEPNQVLITFIGLHRVDARSRNIRRKLS